ncbi:helix-turn-helix domain-containing protein [Stutzerimonas stutzeri]|uniref:hypothetical protein n=1 Tax=Stutzerimonas stutzeri TaxID=316 RepID=UPI0024470C75|nr:hypothetical protein [Stutzerimonas stutzeri]MDH0100093.1 helix-turn-helix domain-containing protein [Stutzerimonas stutzeri]MDH0156510.1 helix-turn-helix domain-containing protein [Stutzerimonas stutzeri]
MPVLKVHASAWDIEPMVQSDDLRSEFVARLKKALAHAGIPEWGAGVRLAEMTGKTPKASSKWWNAESMPGRANMVAIANELGVRVEWLQYGEGAMVAPAENTESCVGEDSPARSATAEQANLLAMITTPRSRRALERIARAAAQGRLTDEDVQLLDRIAARFESAPTERAKGRAGSYEKLRGKLKADDRNSKQ